MSDAEAKELLAQELESLTVSGMRPEEMS